MIEKRFEALKAAHLPAILKLIDEVFLEASPEGSSLLPMLRYQMESGGKRLRALLPLLVAECCGHAPEELIPFGAACEVLHNATLVHDDLQDGDSHRRGRETIWRRFGVPQAINLGDAMFYYPLLLLQGLSQPIKARETISRRLLRETLRVIDGQEREFALQALKRPSLSDYFRMVEGKTSGLFALPMVGAAALCGAQAAPSLVKAALHLGVLFQIQDDLLDLWADKGRTLRGSDIAEGKRSFMVVYSLERAEAPVGARLKEILDRPREETSREEIAEAIKILEHLGAREAALTEIEKRSLAALKAVDQEFSSLVEGLCTLFLAPIQALTSA